ncbi:MAG: FAD-dependent thymidylate synthase, partial [Microcystaceae cyanobacterium]
MQEEGKIGTNFDPLEDGKSQLILVSVMGDDLSVVNDARVSYERNSDSFSERDRKLLNYLVSPPDGHSHTSPLRGCVIKFEVKAPLFVARQWYKHTVASTYVDEQLQWNEKSFRYTQIEETDYYLPVQFYLQSKSNKQKSDTVPIVMSEQYRLALGNHIDYGLALYRGMLEMGVAREQARGVLPAYCYTRFRWTSS